MVDASLKLGTQWFSLLCLVYGTYIKVCFSAHTQLAWPYFLVVATTTALRACGTMPHDLHLLLHRTGLPLIVSNTIGPRAGFGMSRSRPVPGYLLH